MVLSSAWLLLVGFFASIHRFVPEADPSARASAASATRKNLTRPDGNLTRRDCNLTRPGDDLTALRNHLARSIKNGCAVGPSRASNDVVVFESVP